MYIIVAIIRPHRLDAVRDSLQDIDVLGMTVSDCRGLGRQTTPAHTFRGSSYSHGLEPRLRVEIAVTEEHMKPVVDAIQAAATTGEVGDGKIFVYSLDEVVRIRTNERGVPALS